MTDHPVRHVVRARSEIQARAARLGIDHAIDDAADDDIDHAIDHAHVPTPVETVRARVRADPGPSPILERGVGGDWPGRLVRLKDVRASVARNAGRRPAPVRHAPAGAAPKSSATWPAPFEATLRGAAPSPAVAGRFPTRVDRIAAPPHAAMFRGGAPASFDAAPPDAAP